LPKYVPPTHNEPITDPIHKWAWFLTNAAGSSVEEISSRLDEEEFTEAAGVLDMISKTPQQRAAYEARLKFQRDEEARMMYAVEEGKRLGELIGTIRLSQQLLGEHVTSDAEFSEMDLDAMKSVAADLKQRLLSQS